MRQRILRSPEEKGDCQCQTMEVKSRYSSIGVVIPLGSSLVPTIQAQNNTTEFTELTELAEIYEEGDKEIGSIFDDDFFHVNGNWNGTEEAQNGTQPREREWTGTVIQQVVTLSIIMLLTLIGNTQLSS
ncbi:hypothetical protein CEXT_561481 [Caerostris extrusa]|uniref:Uncharacterized protein n=1 Tax=Caerostris extrusa TaxID=172846 RepID=A0AAV4TGE1_CAEEX|nr:hypothetical protein CEXT_561481 [Caerostris extrusa]